MRTVFCLIAGIFLIGLLSLFWPVAVPAPFEQEDAEVLDIAPLDNQSVRQSFAAFVEISERPLFNPARAEAEVPVIVRDVALPISIETEGLFVMGVVVRPGGAKVLLQTSDGIPSPWLAIGEAFQGVTILDIDRQLVRLEMDGEELLLSVGANFAAEDDSNGTRQ